MTFFTRNANFLSRSWVYAVSVRYEICNLKCVAASDVPLTFYYGFYHISTWSVRFRYYSPEMHLEYCIVSFMPKHFHMKAKNFPSEHFLCVTHLHFTHFFPIFTHFFPIFTYFFPHFHPLSSHFHQCYIHFLVIYPHFCPFLPEKRLYNKIRLNRSFSRPKYKSSGKYSIVYPGLTEKSKGIEKQT